MGIPREYGLNAFGCRIGHHCSCRSGKGSVHIPFVSSQVRAEFAVFPRAVAGKGHPDVLAHLSFIQCTEVDKSRAHHHYICMATEPD